MIQHRSQQQQCKRTCRFELLEQRMTLSGMGLIATNTDGAPTSDLNGHSHQQARESAQQSGYFPELSPEHKRTNNHQASHHSELHPPRRDTHTDPHPTHHQHLTHPRHPQSHHSAFERSGQNGNLTAAAASPAISQELTEQSPAPVFNANEALFNPPSATLESLAVVIAQRPNTLSSLTPSSSPNFRSDSLVLTGSTDESALFDNTNDDFPASPENALNPEASNTNSTTNNTLPNSDPRNASASNLSQVRVSTAARTSHSELPTAPQLASPPTHTTEKAADSLFASDFVQHELQIQLRGPQHEGAQLPTDSIHLQLNSLEDLLQILAISRATGHPAANANAATGDRVKGVEQDASHTNQRASRLNPMILLMPTALSHSESAATAKLHPTQMQHTSQWGIPLGRHRAITSTPVHEATSQEPILTGPPGMSDGWQSTSPVDPNSESLTITPTAPRGFAILCGVMIIPLIRRRYQQRYQRSFQSLRD